MITESLAIELTKKHLVNGQDEKPRWYFSNHEGGVVVKVSDKRILHFNRVEVEHARLMLKSRGIE